jgi:hypothetical protein
MPDKPEELADRGAAGTAGVGEDLEKAGEKDSFDNVFEEAAKAEDKADLSAADNPDNVKAGEDDDQNKKIVEDKKEDLPAKTEAEIAADAEAAKAAKVPEKETPEQMEQKYKTLQGMHRHDKAVWDTEKTALLTQIEEAKKAKSPNKEEKKKTAAEEAQETQDFLDNLTAEEKEELDGYEKNFEFVSKMEGMKRTKSLAKVLARIDQLEAKVEERIAKTEAKVEPALKVAEENAREFHVKVIKEGYDLEDGTHIPGHSDFEMYVKDGSIMKWIESKPNYLQGSLKRVAEKGSAQDVVDLLSDFKRENNIQHTVVTSEDATVVDLNQKRAEKKAALTVVKTRKGAVAASQNVADDYEGAFDEALNK